MVVLALHLQYLELLLPMLVAVAVLRVLVELPLVLEA
jgi:hypothetical protein